jgi:hypothetical protein
VQGKKNQGHSLIGINISLEISLVQNKSMNTDISSDGTKCCNLSFQYNFYSFVLYKPQRIIKVFFISLNMTNCALLEVSVRNES